MPLVDALRARRHGFTIVELLVVLSIVAGMLALVIPAVQMARESARRVSCLNNLRQLGIAMRGFEATNGSFPPANSTGVGAMWPPHNPKEHGMFGIILPFLDQGAIFETLGYDFEKNWHQVVNRPAAKTVIPLYACGSTPESPRTIMTDRYPNNTLTWGPACIDYAPLTAVTGNMYAALGLAFPTEKKAAGMLETNRLVTVSHVRDGLSNTLAIVECANRPARMIGRTQMGLRSDSAAAGCNEHNDTVSGAAWADNSTAVPLDGASATTFVPNAECYHTDATGRVPPSGPTSGGRCVMNCTNWAEPYSYHPGGITGLFGDGATRFLAEDIDPLTMVGLVTRAGGEAPAAF